VKNNIAHLPLHRAVGGSKNSATSRSTPSFGNPALRDAAGATIRKLRESDEQKALEKLLEEG